MLPYYYDVKNITNYVDGVGGVYEGIKAGNEKKKKCD